MSYHLVLYFSEQMCVHHSRTNIIINILWWKCTLRWVDIRTYGCIIDVCILIPYYYMFWSTCMFTDENGEFSNVWTNMKKLKNLFTLMFYNRHKSCFHFPFSHYQSQSLATHIIVYINTHVLIVTLPLKFHSNI